MNKTSHAITSSHLPTAVCNNKYICYRSIIVLLPPACIFISRRYQTKSRLDKKSIIWSHFLFILKIKYTKVCGYERLFPVWFLIQHLATEWRVGTRYIHTSLAYCKYIQHKLQDACHHRLPRFQWRFAVWMFQGLYCAKWGHSSFCELLRETFWGRFRISKKF